MKDTLPTGRPLRPLPTSVGADTALPGSEIATLLNLLQDLDTDVRRTFCRVDPTHQLTHRRKDNAVNTHSESRCRTVRLASEAPLPEGYTVRWDADFLVLLRADESEVGRFSEHGATRESIAARAWEDFCQA